MTLVVLPGIWFRIESSVPVRPDRTCVFCSRTTLVHVEAPGRESFGELWNCFLGSLKSQKYKKKMKFWVKICSTFPFALEPIFVGFGCGRFPLFFLFDFFLVCLSFGPQIGTGRGCPRTLGPFDRNPYRFFDFSGLCWRNFGMYRGRNSPTEVYTFMLLTFISHRLIFIDYTLCKNIP